MIHLIKKYFLKNEPLFIYSYNTNSQIQFLLTNYPETIVHSNESQLIRIIDSLTFFDVMGEHNGHIYRSRPSLLLTTRNVSWIQ